MTYPFSSIEDPESAGYTFDTDTTFSSELTSCHFRTSYRGCVGTSDLADYLASLANAMLTDQELADKAWGILETKPPVSAIEFAAGLVFRPTDTAGNIKRRFWSLELRKVSSNLALQHDRRYEEFTEWMNGSPEAILRILMPSYASPFMRYCYISAVREWIITIRHESTELPGVQLGWFPDHHTARKLHAAFSAVQKSARAFYFRNSAIGELGCYRLNFKLPPAEVAA